MLPVRLPAVIRSTKITIFGDGCVWKKELSLEPGQTEIHLSREMDRPRSGIYWVRIQVADRVMVRQMNLLP